MEEKNTIRESRTDWNKLKELPDSNIDFYDVPKLDRAFFSQAQFRMPKRKKAVSIRLDPDVLDWFKHEENSIRRRSMLSFGHTSKLSSSKSPTGTSPDEEPERAIK